MILETAALGLFQGVDAVAFAGYQTRGNLMTITPAGMQSDPVRWGVFGIAAKMFLSGDVAQARRTVGIRYSVNDLTTFSNFESDLYDLAWNHRVLNMGQESKGDVDVAVTSGRSHLTEGEGPHLILYGRSPYVEAQKQQIVHSRNSLYASMGYSLPITIFRSDSFFVPLDTSKTLVSARHGFQTKALESKGLMPIGRNRAQNSSIGFLDTVEHVAGLGGISEGTALLAIRNIVRRWFDPAGDPLVTKSMLLSDTRELIRYPEEKYSVIQTPATAAVYGALPVGRSVSAGALTVQSQSPFGVVVATTVHGKDLRSADKILIKMVTFAGNSGESWEKDAQTPGNPPVVRARGRYPVRTGGIPSERATVVSLGGRVLAEVQLKNGSWEILYDRGKNEMTFFCDTPGGRVRLLPGEGGKMIAERVLYGNATLPMDVNVREIIYPEVTKYVRCTFSAGQ